MPAYTQDALAAAIIAEGQTARTSGTPETLHPVISPKGIVIALATALVESNLTEYANPADPESENFPHDAEGSDHLSDGDFQQQPPWWGTAAERMSPSLSAAMFYHTLVHEHIGTQDYNTDATTPGGWAQMVQGSAFPDRYDTRIADAQAIYDRLSGGAPVPAPAPAPPADPRLAALAAVRPDFNEIADWCPNNEDRGGTTIDCLLAHTQEGAEDDDNAALDLAEFCKASANTNNPVSYHYAARQASDGGVTVVDMVDTDVAAWAVGNSNLRSINYCFAGSDASWSRNQWLTQSKAIDVVAFLVVQDAIKYGIDPTAHITFGPNYDGKPPPVVSDHRYCTKVLQDGNTHVDVGDQFPKDIYGTAVQKYWAAANKVVAPTPPPAPGPMPPAPTYDPTQNPELETLIQTRGRFAMLGNQTMIETLAELRDHLTGSKDAGKQGFSW